MTTSKSSELIYGFLPRLLWPLYLVLIAYACRQAPWPRDIAVASSATLGLSAAAWLALNLTRWVFGPDGPAQKRLLLRADVAEQWKLASFGLIAGGVVFLFPAFLLSRGLIAAGGRPVIAPMVVRVSILLFEFTLLAYAIWMIRKRSAIVCWIMEHADRCAWLIRHRRLAASTFLASLSGVILLDLLGYSFSARRLASGGWQSLAAVGLCWGFHRFLSKSIDRRAWRWVRFGSALARHQNLDDNADVPEDLARKLRKTVRFAVPLLGVFVLCAIWDVDLALFRFIGKQELWPVDAKNEIVVTVGDLTKAITILVMSALAWRHMTTFFVLAVFPRMPDDPGIRFAVVTLCRYLVLAVGLLSGLASIHLGLEKIGVVLAALGVGLGFGLQEIVSNFICGIILLLERPIRVGDVVTVSGTTGKVDRINIRATSIINGDNQSMIVPNRAFITGDLVNWTLKDKVIRVTVRLRVASGTDPNRVADLLLAIAREDADVLLNPVPTALLDDMSDSSLVFLLHAYVPDPSLAGRVRHRLFSHIQKRFVEEGIELSPPGHQVQFKGLGEETSSWIRASLTQRLDHASTIPAPHLHPHSADVAPVPLEDCHRGVDE